MKKFALFAMLLGAGVCTGCDNSAAAKKASADKKAVNADADAKKAEIDAEKKKEEADADAAKAKMKAEDKKADANAKAAGAAVDTDLDTDADPATR